MDGETALERDGNRRTRASNAITTIISNSNNNNDNSTDNDKNDTSNNDNNNTYNNNKGNDMLAEGTALATWMVTNRF